MLITVLHEWTPILNEGGVVDIAYSDFMKVLDKCCTEESRKKPSYYIGNNIFGRVCESFSGEGNNK